MNEMALGCTSCASSRVMRAVVALWISLWIAPVIALVGVLRCVYHPLLPKAIAPYSLAAPERAPP